MLRNRVLTALGAWPKSQLLRPTRPWLGMALCALAWGPIQPAAAAAQPICQWPADTQAIIFDCDGVLVDSEGLHADAWVQALAEHGIAFSYEDYPKFAGKETDLVAQAMAQAHSQLDADALAQTKRRIFAELHQNGVAPVPGAVEFVRLVVAHKEALGIRVGLASASPHQEIEDNLAAIGLRGLFDTVVSGHDDLDGYQDAEGRNKPKPYIYQEAARRLGVDPAHCVAFEDTDVGVRAASSAGMRVFAVPNAWTRTQHFEAAQAVLDSLQACTSAVQ